ncbi:pyrimidine operon attenuation protein/uracil phosphoribosyltransferase [Nonlabens dokdonensis]|jgi:pyrimidine operon attenuation protein/uracil phosphoribosyltransferase|uniref:Pyrimidine operon regulatory phosphoribosyl transferase n=2 Tax=Nonlabens dokdonensis TaxID=328515 RepID=L7WBE0_NONDD|nr:phosphoribosyltransferase family protein [Nonlabens dokdonensis]AGC77527.1 pyrimidine operon regulatory phosphoribosyl transferase [Nonlabens dokdonensis DSW-6]PZX39918.1 pyrimidine operon attenuation protein/uracil phosphoribosyltransferase [Nonlabens dokdonensis]
MENEILNHSQVEHKIRRIAYQIAEVYLNYDKVILAGIDSGGYTLAKEIKKTLSKIIPINIVLCKIQIDKQNPLNQVKTSLKESEYQDCGVIICDDVLNSGTTLIYAVRHFLNVPLARLKTAVLVNRNHKKYPVKADFKGISLSTTLEEHIEVQLDKKPFSVLLK